MNTEIKNDILKVGISSLGAELTNITTNKGTEVLWLGDEKIWEGRSPILFPIVGRLKNDELKINNNSYTLKKHGFAKKTVFSLISKTPNEATFQITSNEETKKLYPFDFEFNVTYKVINNHLNVTYNVVNTGLEAMYFSIGGHPGFNCSMGDTLVFEKKENKERLIMNEDSYISNKSLFLDNTDTITITEDIFNHNALIFEGLESKFVTLKTNKFEVVVSYNEATHLGIWAKPKAPYVCIEPWFGVDDVVDASYSFKNKPGIIELKSKNTFNYSFDIEIIEK